WAWSKSVRIQVAMVRSLPGSPCVSDEEGGGEGVVLRHFTTHRGITTCADQCRNRGSRPTLLRHRGLLRQEFDQRSGALFDLAALKMPFKVPGFRDKRGLSSPARRDSSLPPKGR